MQKINKLAHKTNTYLAVDYAAFSKSLVDSEISVIKKPSLSFFESITKLNKKERNSSIIYKALKYKWCIDEDIVSEALLSLQDASIKYFEQKREINFSQFAIIHIRKRIFDYLNKKNHTNGSDLHEKIHTAIRKIRKSRGNVGNLTFEEASRIANEFNLKNDCGLRKVYELEAIQLGNENDYHINENGDEYYRFDDEKNDLNNYKSQNNIPDTVFNNTYQNQQRKILEEQAKYFIKRCNEREKIIFNKRIFCEEQISLNKLSENLNISFQMVSQIEKKLFEKFISFCKSGLENKKKTGI